MLYSGKEHVASLAILPLVSWTGARFMRQDRKNERRLHGRLERFNRSPIAQSAITSLGSRPSASTRYFPTKPVGFSLWISKKVFHGRCRGFCFHMSAVSDPCDRRALAIRK